jgi:DNA sulfur modification protein DndD
MLWCARRRHTEILPELRRPANYSPFGRLDEVHTTKVVQALPSMADQVLLLVYESELDPNQARNELKGKLRKEYRIARRSARHSELETMS